MWRDNITVGLHQENSTPIIDPTQASPVPSPIGNIVPIHVHRHASTNLSFFPTHEGMQGYIQGGDWHLQASHCHTQLHYASQVKQKTWVTKRPLKEEAMSHSCQAFCFHSYHLNISRVRLKLREQFEEHSCLHMQEGVVDQETMNIWALDI